MAILIENGADPNAAWHEGSRPLHLAATLGDAPTIEALLARGADPNAWNAVSATPLYNAVLNKRLDASKALLAGGADVNAADEDGLTPLMLASNSDQRNMISILLSHGASTVPIDRNGYTALHWAAQFSGPACCALLLEAGADPNATTPEGIALCTWRRFALMMMEQTLRRFSSPDQQHRHTLTPMSEQSEQPHLHDDRPIDESGLSVVESSTEDGGLSPQDERVAELMSHTIDLPELASAVEQQEAADAADTLEDLEDHDAAVVLEQMDDQSAADALSEMQPSLAQGVLEDLIEEDRGQYAATLLGMMAPDDAADMLQAVEQPEREQVLSLLSGQEAVNLRRLLRYGEETAGGVMTTDFLELRDDMTVGQAIERIRVRRLPEGVYKFFVTDGQHRLCGLVSLRDLLITNDIEPITDVMEGALRAVRPDVDREEVARELIATTCRSCRLSTTKIVSWA